MSASLVGSEMCIRDSVHAHARVHARTHAHARERVNAHARTRAHARFLHGTVVQAQEHPSTACNLTCSLSMRHAALCIHSVHRAHPHATGTKT
eukprot:3173774-Alexandrium_andersonii.AAC.1